MLKHGIAAIYHHVSSEHLHRYVTEFTGRASQRDSNTIDQIKAMVRSSEGKQIRYDDLTSHHAPAEVR